MANLMEFTDQNFETEVLNSSEPVLVDFWAEWCGPCRMIGPMVEELSNDYAGKARVGKLNVDHNPDISVKYGIRSIPALLVFKGGQVVETIVGAVPKGKLIAALDNHVEVAA